MLTLPEFGCCVFLTQDGTGFVLGSCSAGSVQWDSCYPGVATCPRVTNHTVPFPAVTASSPMKTLYVMSDAKLSALTKSAMGEVPLKLPAIQPSSSSSSCSPTGAVTFASAASSLLHSKVGPVLQTASKTVILTSALAAVKGDRPLGHVGDKLSLSKSVPALGHALGTAEPLGRVPPAGDEGSVGHGREALASRHLLPQAVLPGGAGTALIALGGSSVIAAAGTALGQKP